jgi:pimeloyl-ACP methyl ester carboxylesterase
VSVEVRAEPVRVEVDPDVYLAVHRSGPVPVDVVLVHGLASTARLWLPAASGLATSGVGSLAVDLRGHGDSDRPEHGYDTQTAAADVVAVLEQRLERPVVLAGQSWGGNVVLRVAAARPDLVRGLALVDGGWIRLAGRFPDWSSALAALTPQAIDGLPVTALRAAMAPSFADFPPGSLDAALSFVRVLPDGTVRRRLPVERHLQILASMWDDDPRTRYPDVAAPVLLLPALPPDDHLPAEVDEAAAALPSARVHGYRGAHHDLHLQHPHEVAADLRSLL